MLACNGRCATRAMLRIDRAQTVLALIPLHAVRLGCVDGDIPQITDVLIT